MTRSTGRRPIVAALALLAPARAADAAERPTRRAGLPAPVPLALPPLAPAPATARNLRFEIQAWDTREGGPRLWGFEAFRAVEGRPRRRASAARAATSSR